ncbi:MAG: septum site-determining protein MinD [Clostridia bacterium]|nr:septum site-determining protein MinD [Clostridia bacterium]
MGRKIVITSGKGGVGKTTVTANLAYALASCGERVVAVDGDLGLNNLDVAMGIEGKIAYDLFDCAEGRCRAKQALVQSPWHKNLFVLPACFGKNRKEPETNAVRAVVGELGSLFDFVLLDCPAGIGEGFRRAVACSEEALVVINPHVSSIRDADKTINLIFENRPCNVGVVVNRMRGDLAAAGEILTPQEIASLLKVKLVGVIPEDDKITSGLSLGRGRCARAFSVLAGNVLKNRCKIFDCQSAYTGFFGSIRRKLKSIL